MALKAEDIRKYIKRTVIAKLKVLLVPGLCHRIFSLILYYPNIYLKDKTGALNLSSLACWDRICLLLKMREEF